MGRAGFEVSSENISELLQDNTLSDTLPTTHSPEMVQNQVHILQKHPDLARIIGAWEGLPEKVKQSIKALVQSYNTEAK